MVSLCVHINVRVYVSVCVPVSNRVYVTFRVRQTERESYKWCANYSTKVYLVS